jgi:hypothetical protein
LSYRSIENQWGIGPGFGTLCSMALFFEIGVDVANVYSVHAAFMQIYNEQVYCANASVA